MPELPEVETLRRSLAPAVARRQVREVRVREPRLRTTVAREFAAQLTGRRIEGLGRHGKYLLATLDSTDVWLVHLGMTGRLTLGGGSATGPHDHVTVMLDDGRVLSYADPRRFGRMAVVAADAVTRETGTGVDALSPALTAEALHLLTRRRRTSVKALLMDQRLVAGIGNIYASEILFHAGIRPRRRAGRLRRAECQRLATAIRAVLTAAIRRGGSSISDYVDGLGRSGWFQLRHRVYDRAGSPCRRCRAAIRSCVVSGRSTYYCPRCQV
jgi:formamidopyrimidine-DNA glycosylase